MTNGTERKKQFKAALVMAGKTAKGWAKEQGVTDAHLNQVVIRARTSERLNAAIDALIAKFNPRKSRAA